MSRSKTLLAIILVLAAAGNAGAGEGDTLITDSAVLKRLGFPPDARNIYLAKGAVIGQKSSSPAEPAEFGTADFGWTTLLGNQHIPWAGGAEYLPNSDGSIYHTGGPNVFNAPLHLPSGALLKQVTFFVRDNGAGFMQGAVLRVCQTGFPVVGPPVSTTLGTAVTDDGDTIVTVIVPPGEVINNFSCAYHAQTVFANATGPQLELRKIRAGWQRQVSAAPLTASFPNDTPTTHPYFRFIEALAHSGITAGCAPGSFCPNSPITRGEMAVFLSVALGLHFTN
jgi:hypothetical protein